MTSSSRPHLVHPSDPAPAAALCPQVRLALALEALAGPRPITQLAQEHAVSRPFIYEQANRARTALHEAFEAVPDEGRPLFLLPVTKDWIRQFVLAQLLIAHSSYRGVVELLRDLLDTPLSVGSVHNIAMEAVAEARKLQATERLDRVRVGAHDEIFQGRRPILVGADVPSTFTYLLSPEDSRDGDTWGIRFLDLKDRGLNPEYTVADAGQGLRAGQAIAWPLTRCRSDVFHALFAAGGLASYLERRALGALAEAQRVATKMAKAKLKGRGNAYSKRQALASQTSERLVQLADDIATLTVWLRDDILALNALPTASRRELFDFVVAELLAREPLAPHRLRPVRTLLQNQRDNLLAFAEEIDQTLTALAAERHVPLTELREQFSDLCRSRGRPDLDAWEADTPGPEAGDPALLALCERTVRASSVIENINSRVRLYIFLRRSLGSAHLDLVRFFLNHRRFLRSEHPERVGKSPAELLTGEAHPHWLELLGFSRFKRAA